MSNQVEIRVQGVKDLLNEGKSREEIAKHYGITMADCKRLFEDEELKGLKAKKQPGFILIKDNTADVVSEETTSPGNVENEEIHGQEVVETPLTEEVTDSKEEIVEETQELEVAGKDEKSWNN